MKKTKQKKQQEKVQQEPSKPFGFEETLDIINQAEAELEAKVKSFRTKGRSDQQIANLLMVSYDIIQKIK
jgi:hypothetical protein